MSIVQKAQEKDMSTRGLLANAIRALSMDAVQKANSGHPGAPMGMADIAEVLWNDFLTHNPANPQWFNRDRFVMSNGHGSMLIYAVLHLSGYDLSLSDIKQFRQLHSKTPGHPENHLTPGVETTTGPLGQGLANAVGMAIAERVLAARYNQDGHPIIDHYTYVFLGDGCMMEGISHEACSLAGTLGLGKLIAFYDDNGVSIDGDVSGWFTDDTPRRFAAYGWHVIPKVDGHDGDAVKQAIESARAIGDKPSLICCKTIIGRGAPNKQGTAACHGTALGAEEVAAARKSLGWTHGEFEIPDAVYQAWDARAKGNKAEDAWQRQLHHYRTAHPALAAELERRIAGELPENWNAAVEDFVTRTAAAAEDMATRKASLLTLNALAPLLPELIGGSADLTGSNLTYHDHSEPISAAQPDGNYIYYGVREFAMSAIMNGLALHGGFIPYGGTFLVFSDYGRNAVRLAALMKNRCIFVYSHDSIGLGEDGPTHQPVEHAASLRLIPNMSVWRPCDAVESALAWQYAIERNDGPTSLLLSRQTLKHQPRTPQQISDIRRGAYILTDSASLPDIIIIATGSEVELAIAAAERCRAIGLAVRVVSMPSCDIFDRQDDAYRNHVLPPQIRKRVAIEAASRDYWRKYVGLEGTIIGLDTFGVSATCNDAFQYFGFSVDNIVESIRSLM